MRVLGLLPYPTDRVPGQRFRIEQWAPALSREGLEITFSPFLSSRAMDVLYQPGHRLTKALETARAYARRLTEVRRFRSYDLAFVFREAALFGPPVFERLVARRLPVVLDFDDAIYLPLANPVNAWSRWLRDSAKTKALCRLARHVTVGNETLAQYAREVSRAVTVVPTTIDTDIYVPRSRPPNPRPVVGWSGSITTIPYLAAMHEPLLQLRQRVDFELRVIGGEVSLTGLDARCQPWRPASEVKDLAAFDVGLMPLPDDPWTRGKCGLKALQYMALGIPPVVSPVGVNAEIVSDGVDGFHAPTPQSWIDRIGQLVSNPALRARLGGEARRTVEARYSARVHVPRVSAILRGAATQRCEART
jgi:glycosyltransferase involved in cell wall biosynthesis